MIAAARIFALIAICGFLGRTEERCSATGWEKIVGVKPESIEARSVLYSAVDSNGITKSCFERCERANCTAFVLDFARSVCYAGRPNDHGDDDDDDDDDELLPEASAIFYHRICLNAPTSCARDRLWQVERNPGAVFIDSGALRVPEPIRRNQCYEICMEPGSNCQSAQFRATKPLSMDDAIGRCSLSFHERGTKPRAYRASMYRDEYLRDQCRNTTSREYCSYAEFRNATLPYSDLALRDLDETECQKRCDLSADGFLCRGYTVLRSVYGPPICLLHSEDTNSLGVSSLMDKPNAIYREREPCLDLKVRCDQSTMTIELRTGEGFFGRMYANGYADSCGVQGTGANRTVLELPVPAADKVREGKLRCGLSPAFPLGDRDRTRPLVWVTVVVQFNPIVQRLGDQAVRVGCSLNERGPPEPRNVTVHSSFSFLDPNAGVPPISTTIVNASSQAPSLVMRILDENSRDAIVTHLGQQLTLKIQATPPNGPYDIAAGHLVASSASGDASYLLLDELGCPTDPTTFPALVKDPRDGRSLIANFTAFKFPNSQLVRFNVMVRFCVARCSPTNCRDGSLSYGRRRRRRRRRRPAEPEPIEPEQLPLQLSIIVRSAVATTADRLSSRNGVPSPDTVLVTGPNSLDGLLCVDASLALSLLIFWLFVQIALIAGCLFTVARYRRTAIRAEEERANVLARHLYGIHGGNFEIARRVRWADRNVSPSSFD